MKSLILWLGLFAAAFALFQYQQSYKIAPENLVQPSAPQDRSAVEGLDGLGYLNFLRETAGLQPLSHSSVLEQSARNHARYLTQHPDDGHDEKNRASPYFTGNRPSERARHTGYMYEGVHENVSTSSRFQDTDRPSEFVVQQQLDGLMTAIYHRFSLLEQSIDEVGVAYETDGAHAALVANQGHRAFDRLCRLGRLKAEPNRYFYKHSCHNGAVVYADEVQNRRELLYTVYPTGHFAMPDFQGERPDPMPGHEFTGNPVSIVFSEQAGRVEMRSFKLYRGEQEIKNTRILTKHSDPNREFDERQFALFPIRPLEYDTLYRAVFEFERKGKKERAQWSFRTKKPDYPYFIVKGDEKLALQSGEKYFIHWQNHWCLKTCPQLVYQQRGGAQLEILERQIGGVLVRVTGVAGGNVRLMFENDRDKALVLYLSS
ncbi:CAP domain-containing protein [Neisseria sp. CCUG12390]|uniref:CAP domain-containing protein n=1 Tax=Neisseria sp. CCUG12390 TaxID=3392035 RepID=UPI003A0FC707